MTDRRVDFSVIIPAYNEAGSIGSVLERLTKYLSSLDQEHEILVVVDGASDASAEEVRGVEGVIRLVEHPYNMGNGAAIKTGIRHARGEVLVFMDADGQHAPEDIGRLLAECRKYDMVVGARGKEAQAGWHRRMANGLYNGLASYVTGRRIEDLTSGFRAMRRSVVSRFVSLLPNGYSYPTTITLCIIRAGFSVKYIPIEVARRQGGKSHIRLFSDGTRFLLVIAKICMLFSPLKIFLPVSLYLFLMGLGYYGYTFLTAHRFTNMSMLLFTTAVMVFMMGLIAEQIAQMRFERSEDG